MKFILTNCKCEFNSEEDKEEITRLAKLGFEFEKTQDLEYDIELVGPARLTIEICDVNELINFITEYGKIVMRLEPFEKKEFIIEIYDDYRE